MLVYAIDPLLGKIMIIGLGVTTVGILITRLIEMVEWKSCLAQEMTGKANRQNKQPYTFAFLPSTETPIEK